MVYQSTRDKSVRVSAANAIARGISAEGGLFVPVSLPVLGEDRLAGLVKMSYVERAADILTDFLGDFTRDEIEACVKAAYGSNFAHEKVAPVVKLGDGIRMLELWHGPTCAFKDMALQLLPHLLTRSLQKAGGGREAAILVATSGDTGKAALEGFADVPGTSILVFYPDGGVSEVQYLQMATQKGGNVGVCGVRGNFDDTQTGVKKIFTDPAMNAALEKKNLMFSSANSINWGRLVPQIVYYVSAYCDLVAMGDIAMGEKVNICVPTGNFGNILAAHYAKRMGLPVGKLICASNINNVLADFIETGVYDRRREFYLTSSPSMDILISSNLERLLFELCGNDDAAVREMMSALSRDGVYSISGEALETLQSEFAGGFCDEQGTRGAIRQMFDRYGYLCDTHTAVAVDVYERYVSRTQDNTKTLIASTANPYKFAKSILPAFMDVDQEMGEFAQAKELSRLTGTKIPQQLAELEGAVPRFAQVCGRDGMEQVVRETLGV